MASLLKLQGGVVARIVRSTDGGPLRRIPKSSGSKPTGTFVSVKGAYRAMPWESIRCELPVIEICEAASPVVTFLAQPHRLELFVRGQARPLIYLADLEATVETDFYKSLMQGRPFGEAALDWRPSDDLRRGTPRLLVIEVKDDADPRIEDRAYQRKLKMAKSVYAKLGIGFLTVVRSRDIACVDANLVRRVTLDRFTKVSPVDVDNCMRILGGRPYGPKLRDVVDALGGGGEGRAKAAALHVSRVFSIDLRRGFIPDAPVAHLGDMAGARHRVAA